MIISNNQSDLLYFKQYPCYSVTTHLSEHRELQFGTVTLVQFSKRTTLKKQLPKVCVDKYQQPHQMYWLEWRVEDVPREVIQEGRKRVQFKEGNIGAIGKEKSQLEQQSSKLTCLYIAQLSKTAHIKLVFNYDPEEVAICQDYLYTIGGNQLIITELWPQSMTLAKNIPSSQQLPPKQKQFIHQLETNSKILSLDFVYAENQQAVCKIVYFHQKKGLFASVYSKDQSYEGSLLGKIMDFSLKFKKSFEEPLWYETLVPNILGLVVHNSKEFSLINLTTMKLVEKSRNKFEDWQLDPNQSILIQSFPVQSRSDFNDCLLIALGQGPTVQLFHFNIKFISTAKIILNNQPIEISTTNYPIHMFSSAEFIDFENCTLQNLCTLNLERVDFLSSMTLTEQGLYYCGYERGIGSLNNEMSTKLPISGYVKYEQPFITNEVLMQENKIWKEFKMDFLQSESQRQDKENCLSRILTPGRFEPWFILKTLNILDLASLSQKVNEYPLTSITERLTYEWRSKYTFLQLVYFNEEVLIIRQNSIGSLIQITKQQFDIEKDDLSITQISYNDVLSRGFSQRFDIEGDQIQDEAMSDDQNGHAEINRKNRNLAHKKLVSFEDKLRSINAKVGRIMEEGWLQMRLQSSDDIQFNVEGYYDPNQIQTFSRLYQKTLKRLFTISKRQSLSSPLPDPINPNTSLNSTSMLQQNQPASQQSKIQLHVSILSLKVKDELIQTLTVLKTYYNHYFQQLLTDLRDPELSKDLTPEVIEKVHLQHVYTVFVLEWVLDIGTKNHLQKQLDLFQSDLIQLFVQEYADKYGARQKNNMFYKDQLDVHVVNVLTLMFRGLLKNFTRQPSRMVGSQIMQPDNLPEGKAVSTHISNLNAKSNQFFLFLLQKHTQLFQRQFSITTNIISSFYRPLLFTKLNLNLSLMIPINKTFIYAILCLPEEKLEKKRILSSYLNSKTFRSLLILIQLENNCYLWMNQGIDDVFYENGVEDFEENTLKLNREQCEIIEEIILVNYRMFLFPDQSQINHTDNSMMQSNISSIQFQEHLADVNQKLTIQFIKILFSNIEFTYLMTSLTQEKQLSNQQKSQIQMQEERQQIDKPSEINSVAVINKKLIQQIQQMNEAYGMKMGTRIQRVFKRFHTKIYRPRINNYHNKYPEVGFTDDRLSMWELDKIAKLYDKQDRTLKEQRKLSFENMKLIQKRMNLEYSMIKIHMFRLKKALKQLPTLRQAEKREYIEVMGQCVSRLRESLYSFENWRLKFYTNPGDVNDYQEDLLETIKQIDCMENMSFGSNNFDAENPESLKENWSLIGVPLSVEWLKLFDLTFIKSIQFAEEAFENYGSLQSILMKILVVIKRKELTEEFKGLEKLFGKEKIDRIIKGNELLKQMYSDGKQSKNEKNQWKLFEKRTAGTLLGSSTNEK